MEIFVDLGPRSYTIVVEAGALATVGERLRALGVGGRAALVSDAAVLRLHGDTARRSVEKAGFTVTAIEVPDGERAKTLAVAAMLWERFLDAGLDRSSTVLALGGGAVGDVAGFAASTYMRGIGVVQLPTTVLAQVDASIGGKTAIDLPRAKNVVGAFHQPRLVITDPALVSTLPPREYRSGLAEVVKHGVVLDAPYFAALERDAARLAAREMTAVETAIAGSCRLKADVIQRDPEEKSELRLALNYGHTVGHALEAATGFARWTHGEAVALGMAAEARLAERLGVGTAETTQRQDALLAVLGLPVRLDAVDVDAVVAAITHDKKSRDGRVPFVVAPRIGAFRLVHDVTAADVRAVLAALAA